MIAYYRLSKGIKKVEELSQLFDPTSTYEKHPFEKECLL